MTTAKQVHANRAQRKSTGPRTTEGKQRTARNAIKHGFRAKDPLIPGEDPDEFYRHAGELHCELLPTSILEDNLVEQLIDITWRSKRFSRIEAAIINELYDKAAEQEENHSKDGEQLLGASLAHEHALNRLSRYEAQLARRYHNVMKELRDVRKQRGRRLALSSLYAKQAAQLQTETATNVDHTPGANEPTQSTESHLESIMKAAEATAYGCLETDHHCRLTPTHSRNTHKIQPRRVIRRPPPSPNPTSPPRTTPPPTTVQPTCAQSPGDDFVAHVCDVPGRAPRDLRARPQAGALSERQWGFPQACGPNQQHVLTRPRGRPCNQHGHLVDSRWRPSPFTGWDFN